MRRVISFACAVALVIAGATLVYVELGHDVPRKIWLMGPFLVALGLGWIADEIWG